jgi:hypothetical protein
MEEPVNPLVGFLHPDNLIHQMMGAQSLRIKTRSVSHQAKHGPACPLGHMDLNSPHFQHRRKTGYLIGAGALLPRYNHNYPFLLAADNINVSMSLYRCS